MSLLLLLLGSSNLLALEIYLKCNHLDVQYKLETYPQGEFCRAKNEKSVPVLMRIDGDTIEHFHRSEYTRINITKMKNGADCEWEYPDLDYFIKNAKKTGYGIKAPWSETSPLPLDQYFVSWGTTKWLKTKIHEEGPNIVIEHNNLNFKSSYRHYLNRITGEYRSGPGRSPMYICDAISEEDYWQENFSIDAVLKQIEREQDNFLKNNKKF